MTQEAEAGSQVQGQSQKLGETQQQFSEDLSHNKIYKGLGISLRGKASLGSIPSNKNKQAHKKAKLYSVSPLEFTANIIILVDWN